MQAGEPLANDAPIMIATARIGIMRIVIAKASSTFIVSSMKKWPQKDRRFYL
jgi:hypothetical protein